MHSLEVKSIIRSSPFSAQEHTSSVRGNFLLRSHVPKRFDYFDAPHDILRRRVNTGVCCNIKPQVFNVNTVDLAAKCAAALGASKLVYIADGSYLEDTMTGMPVCLNVVKTDGAEHVSARNAV